MKTVPVAPVAPASFNAEVLLLVECMLYTINLEMSWSVAARVGDAGFFDHQLTSLAANIDLIRQELSASGRQGLHTLEECMEMAESLVTCPNYTREGMLQRLLSCHERAIALLGKAVPAPDDALAKRLWAALRSSHLELLITASRHIRKGRVRRKETRIQCM